MATGRESPILTTEQALARNYNEQEQAIISRERERAIVGTPDIVKERLQEIQQAFQADELMVITITGDYESRLHSYELLAEAFALNPVSG
jgi:alkanesulfonate monooxygenase SsuD/methylene tetrahydromethanopterin reductase-like flavin-dependent oxidoreductase (luciferase family)